MNNANPEYASFDHLKQLFSERCEAIISAQVGQVAVAHDTVAVVSYLPIEEAFSLDIMQTFTDDFLQEATIYKEVTLDTTGRLCAVVDVDSNPTPEGYNNLASAEVENFQAKADSLKYSNQTMHDHLTEVLDLDELMLMHAMLHTSREELLEYLGILDRILVSVDDRNVQD